MQQIEIENFFQNINCDVADVEELHLKDEALFQSNYTRLMDDYCGRN